MRSFLLQPYPFGDNPRNKLLICAGIGVFITLFLAVFEPFGFDQLTAPVKWQHAAAFGAVSFVVASVFQILLPKLLPGLFKEENWRSWKEILFLLITTAAVGAANFALMLYLYPQTVTLANFFRAERITLQVGVFPILFVVFLKQLTLYQRYAAEAKSASEELHAEQKEQEPTINAPAAPRLILRGDNQKEELSLLPNELFFVASADNYVKAQFRGGQTVKIAVLRSTLKKMEDQLAAHPQFFRCHRMYIVNLQNVTEVSGNAQGLKLHFTELNEAIPVSRNLTETVREKLHALSRSPQTG